ncbi:hypothetical protein GVN18_28935 [Pseudomonas sp. ODNR1LW]|nr:hypothetical protein [Pseudomonas sp. ODNR1LW]
MSVIALMAFGAVLQTAPAAEAILQRLDLTSFRNSTGPAGSPGLKYPRDWTFTDLSVEDDVARLDRKGDWAISLRVLRPVSDGVVVCFMDRALNGGSYNARQALLVAPDGEGGFRVVDEDLSEPGCEPLPGQG